MILAMTGNPPLNRQLRQRLHGTESVLNQYEIGTDKPCVYTGAGESGTDRICYLAPGGSTYEGDPIWNRNVSVSKRFPIPCKRSLTS